MTDRVRNIIVGVTTILGLAGFGWLVMIFGELPKWTEKGYPIHVHINDAQGLAAGSRVRLSGVDIGEVEAIALLPDLRAVDITCRIRQKYDIPRGSLVTATSSLLGGVASLSITPPEKFAPGAILPKDGSAPPLQGETASITSELQNLARKLSASLPEQLENLNTMTKKFGQLVDTYDAVGRELRGMVEQRSVADVDAGKAQGNLATILARADQRVAELKQAVAGLNAVLGDEKLIADLKATIGGARQLTDNGNKLAANLNDKLDQLTRKAFSAIDDLGKSLLNLDGLITDARAGKGTVGKLMTDPAMYDNFTDAAARLSDAIKEMKLLIQKWKSEGLPVQF